jgi:hypothetical protein
LKKTEKEKTRELYKVINKFKKDYQPCAYILKKYDGTIIVDTTSLLGRWEHFCSILLKVQTSSTLEGNQTHNADPSIPGLIF